MNWWENHGCATAGGFRGAYKGILSAAMGSAPGAAMFFSTYETMKKARQDIDQLFMVKEIVSTSVFWRFSIILVPFGWLARFF